MRFLFVDRILEFEKNKSAAGIKNVSFSDEYLANIAPGFPIMPRSLSVEAIAQLFSWLTIFSMDFTVKPIAVMARNMKFYGDARPGDQMFLNVEIMSMHETEAICKGTVTVDGKIITELNDAICAFIPMDEMEDVSIVKDISFSLFANRSVKDYIKNKSNTLREFSDPDRHNYKLNLVDNILELEPGKHIRGVKNFVRSDDVASDHFPRKPVMPGTMMIESLAQISERLLARTVKEKNGSNIKILLKEMTKTKFRKFVEPGDQLTLDVNLIKLEDDSALVKAKATVEGKLAVSSQIEFEFVHL